MEMTIYYSLRAETLRWKSIWDSSETTAAADTFSSPNSFEIVSIFHYIYNF